MKKGLTFQGKVVAETRVKTAQGTKVCITLGGGVFLEITNIKDEKIFKKLCELATLDKHLYLKLEPRK